MKNLLFYGCILININVSAQTIFTTNSLPSQIGEDNLCYFSTNVDVTKLIALSSTNFGAPFPGGDTNIVQYWNFSQPENSNEMVLRTDIVAPSTTTYGGYFPNATYAELQTMGTNEIGSEYFGFTGDGANQSGRVNYGFDSPVDMPVQEWAPFTPPIVDIPATVHLGQTWNCSTYWFQTYFYSIAISNSYTSTATVDAAGTLNLPYLGEVPALRIHQVDTFIAYNTNYLTFPLLLSTNQCYLWVVPGIGVAAQVTLYGNNFEKLATMPFTNSFQRMFFASYYSPPQPVQQPTDLYITNHAGSIVLSWEAMTNAVQYRIDFSDLQTASWQTLGYSPGNSWTDAPMVKQRFYRVVGLK